ncbi:MAG: hypothetical protein KDA32_15425, partial [Phycisphaerales bacterium]|nr:hypothetical protein [Phycisphaerales bacterium]
MTRPCLMVALFAVVLSLGGCPFDPFAGSAFLGFESSAGKFLLVQRQGVGLPPAEPTAQTAHLTEVDLATGETTNLAADIVAIDSDIVASENWIAWIDRDSGQIFAIDRQSQKRRALYATDAAPEPNPAAEGGRVLGIHGDRL